WSSDVCSSDLRNRQKQDTGTDCGAEKRDGPGPIHCAFSFGLLNSLRNRHLMNAPCCCATNPKLSSVMICFIPPTNPLYGSNHVMGNLGFVENLALLPTCVLAWGADC